MIAQGRSLIVAARKFVSDRVPSVDAPGLFRLDPGDSLNLRRLHVSNIAVERIHQSGIVNLTGEI
jgi:hypothetical protein